jgi:hypothetical protein
MNVFLLTQDAAVSLMVASLTCSLCAIAWCWVLDLLERRHD